MNRYLIEKLYQGERLTKSELLSLIQLNDSEEIDFLCRSANQKKEQTYGKKVLIRGLIEFSNYCKNNCYYCGIRCSNHKVSRYRMSLEEILETCQVGDELGIQTYVLQSGEDSFFSDDKLCQLITEIKKRYPSKAVTLSIGEKSYNSYFKFRQSGADRYLLRHETASEEHYKQLHPQEMTFLNRMQCLENLKKIGFQTGAGFMVGSPYQTDEDLVKDLMLLNHLKPQMIGIGPFIHHPDTPFANFKDGSAEKTIILIALTRLLLPYSLIPSTTALSTVSESHRNRALYSGANVVMVNLTPTAYRKNYSLYQDKISQKDETVELFHNLCDSITSSGLTVDFSVGHYPK